MSSLSVCALLTFSASAKRILAPQEECRRLPWLSCITWLKAVLDKLYTLTLEQPICLRMARNDDDDDDLSAVGHVTPKAQPPFKKFLMVLHSLSTAMSSQDSGGSPVQSAGLLLVMNCCYRKDNPLTLWKGNLALLNMSCSTVGCYAEIAGESQEERCKEDWTIPEDDRKLRLSLTSCTLTLSMTLRQRHLMLFDFMHSLQLNLLKNAVKHLCMFVLCWCFTVIVHSFVVFYFR